MAQQIINVGTTANDGTGDLLRNGFIKVNQNFTELYTNRISGSGTDNYIPRFNGTNALENSIIFDNGTNIGIGTASPSVELALFNSSTPRFHLQNSTSGTGSTSGFQIALSSTDSYLWNFQNGANIFGTNNSEKMRITSGGNVGIGTTNPTAAKFVLNSGTTNQNALINGDKIGFTRTSDSAEVVYFKKDTSLGAEGTANINGYDGIQFRTQGAESVKAIITSGGNVGIGTTNPTEKLHVAGVAQILDDGTKGRITFQISSSQNDLFSTTTGFGAYRNLKLSSNELILSSGGTTERMRITSGGNVGIGTTTPASKLNVLGDNITVSAGYGIAFAGDQSRIMTPEDNVSGALIRYGSGGIMRFVNGSTEHMRIDGIGNVGIGTTTADYRTQIETTSANVFLVKNTSSTSFNRSYFYNNNNIGTQFLNFGSAYGFGTEFGVGQNGSVLQSNTTSAFAIGTSTSTPLYLGTNGTERMRITSGGDVFVGRTSNWVAVGTDKGLGLFSSGAVYSVVENDNAALFSRRSSDGDLILFRRDTNTVGSISVTTTLTSYNVTSDYRLKQDFKNFNGLELLSKIKVYDFAWNVDNSRMNGVIAHELQEVVPYAVTGEKDGEKMQQVDYSKLVPILVQAIQEQQKQIKELQTLIN